MTFSKLQFLWITFKLKLELSHPFVYWFYTFTLLYIFQSTQLYNYIAVYYIVVLTEIYIIKWIYLNITLIPFTVTETKLISSTRSNEVECGQSDITDQITLTTTTTTTTTTAAVPFHGLQTFPHGPDYKPSRQTSFTHSTIATKRKRWDKLED
jgi:hypothetical protein